MALVEQNKESPAQPLDGQLVLGAAAAAKLHAPAAVAQEVSKDRGSCYGVYRPAARLFCVF